MFSATSGFRPRHPSITCNKTKFCTHLYTQHLFEPISRWEKKGGWYKSGLQQSILCNDVLPNTKKVSADRRLVKIEVRVIVM